MMAAPVIIIDTIQQALLPFSVPTERGILDTGNHSVKDLDCFVMVVESLLAKYVRELEKKFKAVA